MALCGRCSKARPHLKRPETLELLCKDCFSFCFEEEVLDTIRRFDLISEGDIVAVGVSGGKDSTVLTHVLDTLNRRHNLNFRIELVCIDEGIAGYRDHALQTVQRNSVKYSLPLTILSFTELFGWTLDQIFRETQTKETCTYCGIFRRRSLDLGAQRVQATKVAVGHNADDIAETVLLNVLRGDSGRFGRSVDIKTNGIQTALQGSAIPPRIKPFAFQNQKEIVLYAHYNQLDYYAVECPYAVQAFRRFPRNYLVGKQGEDPKLMRRIIEGAIAFQTEAPEEEGSDIRFCEKCGAASNHAVCMACKLLEKLAKGHAERAVVEDEEPQ
jgi:cytoplasmic tRNA 2-thiolation protein 1